MSPPVGTFFFRVRARPVLSRPFVLTHPVPTLAPRSFVSRSGVPPVVRSSGPCLLGWVVLSFGVGRVPLGGCFLGWGWWVCGGCCASGLTYLLPGEWVCFAYVSSRPGASFVGGGLG